MTKSFTRTLLGALALTLLIPAAAMAQATDTDSAQALANIIEPITIATTADLNFGDIVADAVGGTVVVDTAGVATSGSLTLLGNESAAAFTVTGTAGRSFVVTFPLASFNITGPALATMQVNTLTFNCGTCTIGEPLTVGGTLVVGASQTPGAYLGNFDVTVSYN